MKEVIKTEMETALEALKYQPLAEFCFEFFCQPHSDASQVENLRQYFNQCDVFIPEDVVATKADQDFLNLFADQIVNEVDVRIAAEKAKQAKHSEAVEPPTDVKNRLWTNPLAHMIKKSGKKIALIGSPPEDPLVSSLYDSVNNMARAFAGRERDFSEMLVSVSAVIKEYAEVQAERERRLLLRLPVVLSELVQQFPELPVQSKVLIQLGTMHTPVYQAVYSVVGDRASLFADTKEGQHRSEVVMAFRNGQSPTGEMLSRTWLENRLHYVLAPLIINKILNGVQMLTVSFQLSGMMPLEYIEEIYRVWQKDGEIASIRRYLVVLEAQGRIRIPDVLVESWGELVRSSR